MITSVTSRNIEHLLLPHEPLLIRRKLKELEAVQVVNGQLLHEAMSQGAETFHDNAPADSVRDDQEVLLLRARPLLRIISSYIQVDYPDPHDEQITIGSLARISIDGSSLFNIGIVGFVDDTVDEPTQTTYHSPLAQAINSHKIGDHVSWHTDSGIIKNIEIVDIDQMFIRAYYSE